MDSKLKCLFVLPETNGGVNEPMSGNRDSWQSTSGNGDSPQIKVRQYIAFDMEHWRQKNFSK